MTATYKSLRDWSETRLADRIVVYMRPPRGFTVRAVGNEERALVPLDGLDVFFAEFSGLGMRNRRRHSRSYKLHVYEKDGRYIWGGPEKNGTTSYRFLDRAEEENSIMSRFRKLLFDNSADVVAPIELHEALPKPVLKVSPHADVSWDTEAMEAYIRKLFVDEVIRLEKGEDTGDGITEGLIIDFEDLGIDAVITPEKRGPEGFQFAGDLSSVDRIKDALGMEVFNKLVLETWKILCRSGIIPLHLVRPEDRKRLAAHTYWDMSDYMRLSRKTVGKDPEKGYEWFTVVTYDSLAELHLDIGAAVFDFADNFERNRLNDVLRSKREQRQRDARMAKQPVPVQDEGTAKAE